VATKKKTFDAIAASRRWRREASRVVRDMTPEERMVFFNRRLANRHAVPVAKPSRRASALTHR
jgi:hypothetical protein